MMTAVQVIGIDPVSISNAKKCKDWPKWDLAIQCKLAQHKQVGTWKLGKPPETANIVGSCFVFHYKHNSDGNVASQKARLIAQGFTQEYGIDYRETFSLTVKLSAIHVIAVIAVKNNWELEQTDIDGMYLNAPLSETIYMCQLIGYETPGKEQHICLLKCMLYGLKQAGWEWYHLFCEVMRKLKFTQCWPKTLYSTNTQTMTPSLSPWILMTSEWPEKIGRPSYNSRISCMKSSRSKILETYAGC